MKKPDLLANVMEKISYHVVYDSNIHNSIEFAAANGFTGLQIAVELPRFSPERYSKSNQQAIKAHAQTLGIRLNLHGPDEITSLFVSHPALLNGIRDYYLDLFDFAEGIGAEMLTIHIGKLPGFAKTMIPPPMQFRMKINHSSKPN